jgi:hypothetical protein
MRIDCLRWQASIYVNFFRFYLKSQNEYKSIKGTCIIRSLEHKKVCLGTRNKTNFLLMGVAN